MTSAINTGSINPNYPVPGINNKSQGFRDNFASIKTSLDTAATELTDLQGKVLVKSALTGTTINNDMAGGQISNVLTLGFRNTTTPLGSNLNGIVTIDCSKADVHTGTVTGDCSLDFSKWAPSETQGRVEIILEVSAGQKIAFPDNVKYGLDTIEGFKDNGITRAVTIPATMPKVHWVFSSVDCGANVEIQAIDAPRITRQIKFGAPSHSYGAPGDSQGAIMVDSSYLYVCLADYVDTSTPIWSRTLLGAPNSW